MELLIRVIDKTASPPDPINDALCTKAGDIIAIQPDGWAWGTQERLNPDWRIVTVTGLLQSEINSLLAPEPPPTLDRVYYLLRKRGIKFDLTLLPAIAFNRLMRVPRNDTGLTITLVQARAIVVVKPKLPE